VGGEVYYNSPEVTGQKNTMGFNLGVIYTINDNYQILFSAGRNLINAKDTNQFPRTSVFSSTSDRRPRT
jgi:hemolysin activation/secretion protein